MGTTRAGALGKANVGISNDKEREMRSRRKARPMAETVEIPSLPLMATVETQVWHRRALTE